MKAVMSRMRNRNVGRNASSWLEVWRVGDFPAASVRRAARLAAPEMCIRDRRNPGVKLHDACEPLVARARRAEGTGLIELDHVAAHRSGILDAAVT